MQQSPKVFVIILNWNGKEDTLECLESVRKIDYPNFTTLVVDNGSSDGSEEAFRAAFPDIAVLQTGENLGFAEGNNIGIRFAMDKAADYVFILNNDTIVDPHVVSALVDEAERNPKAAILGSKIYFYDRPDIINSAGGAFHHDIFKPYHIGYGFKEDNKTYSEVNSVEWITGCAILLRILPLREVGLFDPDYFLICEELDLCTRVRKHGYEILFVPASKVWHKISASFEGSYSPVYCYYQFRNLLLYARKNVGRKRFAVYRQLINNSKMFYEQLKNANDLDYRNKGFFIFLGILAFFLGRHGKAPSWLLNLRIFGKKAPATVKAAKAVIEDLFSAQIVVDTTSLEVRAGTSFTIPVRVKNLSKYTWRGNSGTPVRLSYHLFSEKGETIVWDGARTILPNKLSPGQEAQLTARVDVPADKGNYIIELDMVQEMVCWFGSKGSRTARHNLIVN